MLLKLLFRVILLPICFAYFKKRYDNYCLLSAVPVTLQQLYFFHSLQDESSMGVDYWVRPGSVNHSVSLIVPPENKTLFLDKAGMLGINVTILLENVQRAFDKQKPKLYVRRNLETFDWHNYYNLEGIYSWLQDLVFRYSDRINLINIGKSFEGRDILGIYLPSRRKHNVVIEGGIHGREWISPAFVTYLIYQLVTAKERDDKELLRAAKKYSWHLFPVLNPDGYAFTHSQDRNWKKNRRNFTNGQFGVDLNRNFDYNFDTVGISHNTAKETYCGQSAFSEPESKAVFDYIDKIGEELIFYMSFHSFGQYFIIPYADSTGHKGNYKQVKRLAENGLKKLKSFYNTTYTIGTTHDTFGYVVSGSSSDWVKQKYKVKAAVSFELRDRGVHGYALPPSEILPTCKETVACILDMVNARPAPTPVRRFYTGNTKKLKFLRNSSVKKTSDVIAVVILNIILWG